jgi:hypothetical protein
VKVVPPVPLVVVVVVNGPELEVVPPVPVAALPPAHAAAEPKRLSTIRERREGLVALMVTVGVRGVGGAWGARPLYCGARAAPR